MSVAIAPVRRGMLVESDSRGRVQPHSTAGGQHSGRFVVGRDFAVGENVDEWVYENRHHGQHWPVTIRDIEVLVVGGTVVSAGNSLVSNGDGLLINWRRLEAEVGANNIKQVVATALETIDLTNEDDGLVRARVCLITS